MKNKILIYKALILCLLFLLAVSFTSAVDMKWKKNDGTKNDGTFSDVINLNNNNYLFIPKQVTPATCYPDCDEMQMSAGETYMAYVNVFDKDNFILHWAVDDGGKISIYDGLTGALVTEKQKALGDDDGTQYIAKEMTDFGEKYTIWKPSLPKNGVYKIVVAMTDAGSHENYVLVKLCGNMQGSFWKPSCQTNTVYSGKLQLDSNPPLYRKCTSFCQTDEEDIAWCSSANNCVYEGNCYNSGTAQDLNNNNKADAFCKETTTTLSDLCSYNCCSMSEPPRRGDPEEYYCPPTYKKTCRSQTCTNTECGDCPGGYAPMDHQLEQTTSTDTLWVDCDSGSEVCAVCDSATDFGCNGKQCFLNNNCCGDDDNEFFKTGTDGTSACCEDSNKKVVNGVCYAAEEICNDIDDDGDGLIDEDWPDKGKPCSVGVGECKREGIYICSDSHTNTMLVCNTVPGNPSPEVYDLKDNDCDGVVDEGFDADGDGYVSAVVGGNDCDDNNTAIHPRATEICNGVDDDCNAATLDGSGEAIPLNPLQNGVCAGSKQVCNSRWTPDYSRVANYEAVETKYDGLDNDCNGIIDDNFPYGWWLITRGDKFPDFLQLGQFQNIIKLENALKIVNDGSYANKKTGIKSTPVSVSGMNVLSASVQADCAYKGDKIILEIRDSNDNVVASVSGIKGASPTLNLKLEKEISGMDLQKAYVAIYVSNGGECVIRNPVLLEGQLSNSVPLPSETLSQYCCPENKCWNGIKCIENMQNPGEEWGSLSSNYLCINGFWSTDKKQTWDKRISGWCSDESSCLVNPTGQERTLAQYLDDFNAVYSETPSQVNIKCIKSGEYLGDHYCNKGEWETRTRDVALQMLEIVNINGLDYSLFCDSYQNVLNYFGYGLSGSSAENYLTGIRILPENKFSCTGSDKPYMPCTNNFCALSYKDLSGKENVVIGTSLNQELESGSYPFISVVGTAGECNNIVFNKDAYQECRSHKIWYNPIKKTILYSGNPISAWGSPSFFDLIKNPISSIIRYILNIWGPSPGLGQSYQFIDEKKDFNNVYFFTDRGYSKSVIGFKETPPYFALKFSGYKSDLVAAVREKFPVPSGIKDDIDTKKQCGSQFLITSAENPLKLWTDLTAKLRTQKEASENEECTCAAIGGTICKPDQTCEKNREIIEFDSLANEPRCCTGGSCVRSCSDIGGTICFDGQTCSGTIDSDVTDTNMCCVRGDCVTTQCSAFGNEFTAGSSLTSTCTGILKRGHLTISAPYGSLECCSAAWVPKCTTDSDCVPNNCCKTQYCVVKSLAPSCAEVVCGGEWGCASSTPTVTCAGWGSCVCNNGKCSAALCNENCMTARCEGLIWKHNGVCSRSGTCQFTSTSCDDNIACTEDSCTYYGCTHNPINSRCDDGNVCTDDVCTLTGCTHKFNTITCNDNNPNTQNDRCSNGVCAGTLINCNDGIPCTVDTLNNGVCAHTPNNALCDDNNFCTIDSCSTTTGCSNTPKDCGVYNCNPLTGQCNPICTENQQCSDGTFCKEGTCGWSIVITQNKQIISGSFDDLKTAIMDHDGELYFSDQKLHLHSNSCAQYTPYGSKITYWACGGLTHECTIGDTSASTLYQVYSSGEIWECNGHCGGTTKDMPCENYNWDIQNSRWYYKGTT